MGFIVSPRALSLSLSLFVQTTDHDMDPAERRTFLGKCWGCLLYVGLLDCYWKKRQPVLLLHTGWKHHACRVKVCPTTFNMCSSKSSCTTKLRMCIYRILISLSVDSILRCTHMIAQSDYDLHVRLSFRSSARNSVPTGRIFIKFQ
jgi:hypothetical protein